MEPIYLSSRVTVLYKLILPIFFGFITLLIWVAAIALIGAKDGEALIVIALVFTGFMLLMVPPMLVQRVWYDDEKLYANNYRKTKEIPLSKVKGVRRWMFYFYKIDYLNEKNEKKGVLFMPHIIERFEAMMGMPESLEIFEEEVIG
jgi:hypothetical protein